LNKIYNTVSLLLIDLNSLFNSAVSITVLDDRMINEWWIWKDLEGSGYCKNKSTKKSLNCLLATLKHSYGGNPEDEIKKIKWHIEISFLKKATWSVSQFVALLQLNCKNCEFFRYWHWKCNKCIHMIPKWRKWKTEFFCLYTHYLSLNMIHFCVYDVGLYLLFYLGKLSLLHPTMKVNFYVNLVIIFVWIYWKIVKLKLLITPAE
jgi:hypothetical protein